MERIVGHICVGYLEGWENLEDQESLITKLLKNGSIDQLSEIVSFFWMQRDEITDKIRATIKPLWRNLFEVMSQNEEQLKYQEVISDLSRWLSLVEHMDEQVFEWLKLSVKYIETKFNSHFLIEYLVPHAAKTPALVGEIYLNMLALGVYPQYKKENIEEMVRTLYASGCKEIADRICISYLAKEIDFLKSIYEEHMGRKA